MRILGIGLSYAFFGSGIALAADVGFSGTVLAACSLSVTTPGTLDLSSDGGTLGSEEGLGTSAALAILSIGDHTVTVDAPTLETSPAGYSASGQQLEVAYSGLSGLAGIAQAYTPSLTSFQIGTISLSTLVVNNRVVNSYGFDAGSYATKTVVTCS